MVNTEAGEKTNIRKNIKLRIVDSLSNMFPANTSPSNIKLA